MFWTSAVVGWSAIAWGVGGIVRQSVDTRPGDLVRFVVGGILVHDLVVVPLVLVAAWVVLRAVPARWRRWVQATLIVAGPLTLFASPMVRGYGRIPGNPTALPHDYAANVGLVLLVVVGTVALGAVVGMVRRRE